MKYEKGQAVRVRGIVDSYLATYFKESTANGWHLVRVSDVSAHEPKPDSTLLVHTNDLEPA